MMLLIATYLLGLLSFQEGEFGVSERVFREFTRDVVALAKKGRSSEVHEVLGLLEELECPDELFQKTRSDCEKALAKGKRPAKKVSREVKKFKEEVDRLATTLESLNEPQRSQFVEILLRLDASQESACLAKGLIALENGSYGPTGMKEMFDRREARREAILQARRMSFEFRTGTGQSEALRSVFKDYAHRTWLGGFSIETYLPQDRANRILTTSLQAFSLLHYLIHGELRVPKFQGITNICILPTRSKDVFRIFVDRAFKGRSRLPEPQDYEYSGVDLGSAKMLRFGTEAQLEIGCLLTGSSWWDQEAQMGLVLGLLNWLTLEFIGDQLPGFGSAEEIQQKGLSSTYYTGRRLETEVFYRAAQTGLAGCREWIRHEALMKRDPPFQMALVDDEAQIFGPVLLKATMVAEYLLDCGLFGELLDATRGKPATPNTFFDAIGMEAIEFEDRWREWILYPRKGIVQRLESPVSQNPQAEEAAETLDAIRKKMWPDSGLGAYVPLTIQPSLCDSAQSHAQYLELNPEQKKKWPDAHEEYPDREGFTVEGSRAGLASVISFRKSPKEAIDSWMDTFYHRLPLLDPWLLAIGYGATERVNVLNAGAMVSQPRAEVFVVWPVPDDRRVPRSFAPELPNPVPGEDQGQWGYPVTVQKFSIADSDRTQLSMELHLGGPDGPLVEAYFSSPDAPTNPEIAPDGAWCLIPKKTLRANSEYTVVAQDTLGTWAKTWGFRTKK